MKLPAVEGIIERRILVNYRVHPDAIERVLPPPFRPRLVGEYAIAGICLIRLAKLRPRGLPGGLGLRSENAAHRIAVEWDADGRTHEGVYIPRRDSDSWLTSAVGGRLFSSQHARAEFMVAESGDRFDVRLRSQDDRTQVAVRGSVARSLPSDSVFASVAEASEFFRGGSVGYSATTRAGLYDGLELRVAEWRVDPMNVEHVSSSFFDDPRIFPVGAATFDCALVMRDISHSWHTLASLSCASAAVPRTRKADVTERR